MDDEIKNKRNSKEFIISILPYSNQNNDTKEKYLTQFRRSCNNR